MIRHIENITRMKKVDLCGSSFVKLQNVNIYLVYQEQIPCFTINVRIAKRAEIIIIM